MAWYDLKIYGVSLLEILVGITIIFLAFIIAKIVYWFVEKYLEKLVKKSKTEIDDLLLKNIKRPIYISIILAGVYVAIFSITSLQKYAYLIYLKNIFSVLFIILVAYAVASILNVIIIAVWRRGASKVVKEHEKHILWILKTTAYFFVYFIAFIMILGVFNIDVTAFIATLGIMGIAIALAVQSTLSDLISTVTIYFDHPFEVGDLVRIKNYEGYVSAIGWRTTRIITTSGDLAVIPNKMVVSSPVENLSRVKERKIKININVKISEDAITKDIKKILVDTCKNFEDIDDFSVHLQSISGTTMGYEIIASARCDYNRMMEIKENLLMKIYTELRNRGFEIA